ncbi:Uncharacterized conserved protein YafD, endonuclease/exonuclease/phosphatase (EEP) superfamily [Quadrisphaera granulorum]|uniref:Endonuclease/exonuclease/phosphatase (EEP) superfamily protein YafD n=1 Tax=Quadrisphaera granulorum TaxID=317664 RepID=A0A316AAM9_9ACTN|nr:endonuclease/exonuclease/phosphatase (EEP) superfamily protein YafD [Quadrisphaera granulorum]SZE95781.1 Uncharacterized conserved protein YafD, endonuclease/exonuclease/phosphatase (EEP) superfamily [Quadrisphaera granulorum]
MIAALVALPAVVTALPGAGGLAGWGPVVQVIPFRGVLVVALLLTAVGVLCVAEVAALLRRSRAQSTSPSRSRARNGPAAVLAGGLALAAALHGAVLVARGVAPAADVPRVAGDVVVVSLNTEFGGSSGAQIAAAVSAADADVVVLPETPQMLAQRAADALPRSYQVFTATTSPQPNHATSLLVAADLGTAAPAAAPRVTLAAVAATVPSLPGPVVAVHPLAPVPVGGAVEQWRVEVPRAVAACADAPGAIVAGDFNTTLDHPGLRDLGPCVDAAASSGAGGLGTWPSIAPALLAAPIDHVLVDDRTWRVLSTRVVVVGDSDHRGLVVHLRRR